MILLKKALRSIWRAKRAFAACVFLIGLGIASYVGFSQTGTHMVNAMNRFYSDQGFGDAFASVAGIPQGTAHSLARLEGVREGVSRAAVTARFLNGGEQQLSLRILSWEGEEGLNRPLLTQGRLPGSGEIALSQNFFEAQGLSLGETVAVTANGRQLRPIVTGVVISPEYIVEVGEGLTGDGATAGYAYMGPAEVRTLGDLGQYDNELVFLLEDGVAFQELEEDLEQALSPYGLTILYGRADHPSHQDAWMSVASLSSTAALIAFVFLGVAVLVLTILLRRVIEQERTQIGTLKAFGLSEATLLPLYILYGVIVSLAGCLVGCLGGLGIAHWASGLYFSLFLMPGIPMAVEGGLLAAAAVVALLAGGIGAAMGARSVLRLSPADSMRAPAPPAMKRKRAKERPSRLPAPVSMAIRGIARGRGRSAFVAGGLAVAFAILAFMASYAAMMDEVLLAEFEYAQLYDMKISLLEPRAYSGAVQAAIALPGVEGAQGLLELPVTLYRGHLNKEAALTGLTGSDGMRRLYDSRLKEELALPEQGIVLGLSLAEKLDAGLGDTVQFTTAYTGDERFTVTVSGLLAENSGYTAYMNLEDLCGRIGAQATANSLLVRTKAPESVMETLTEGENIGLVVDQASQRRVVQNMLDQTLGVNLGLFLVIGFGVAFAIIVTTASVSLSERAREYATMKVLGMEPGRIGATLLLEYLLLALAGFLPGIPLAVGLKALLISAMSVDTLYLSTAISPASFLVGAALCLGVVALASLSSVGQIGKLDMTETLKERE